MLGLEFSLASFVNVTASGLIGASVTLGVAYCTTRETRKSLSIIASFISDQDPGRFITVDESGRLTGKGFDVGPVTLDLEQFTPEQRERLVENLTDDNQADDES